MDADVTATTLVNQATTERQYGVQNAPRTESGASTPYDGIATSYDAEHPTSTVLGEALADAIATLSGGHPPAVLDVGCGTGRVLDLGLTRPDRYAGVDPSTPMLNQLIRKYPGVGAVLPATIEAVLAAGTFSPGQFEVVTVLLDDVDYLRPGMEHAIRAIASRGVISAIGDHVEVTRV